VINQRQDFIKGQVVDGVKEKDFLLNAFNKFTFSRPMGQYSLLYGDYMRPDLISLKVYGKIDYWWIVLKVNPGLDDIWNDFSISDSAENKYPDSLEVGSLISVPHILDINDFFVFGKSFVES
jgi:hypothetical protein